MHYRPRLISRAAHAILGVIPAGAGWGLAAEGREVWRVTAALALMIAGAYVVVRAFRLEVEVDRGDVVARGLLWSRRIPLASVSRVSDFPAIVWRDGRGRTRWTPLVGLMTGSRMLGFVARHNRRQTDRLARDLRRRRRD